MASNRTNPAAAVLGGLLSGIVIGVTCTRRDMQAGEPSIIDKVKDFESRFYAEGERKADTFKQIKQEAKHTASLEK